MSRTTPTPSTRPRLVGQARLAAALAAACSSDGGTVDLGTGGGTSSPETPPPGASVPALPEVLTRYFAQNFDAYEAAARQLINYDRRYTVQDARDLTRYRDFTCASGNPIENAGVHYAHAAGLTGAGQSIAIADTGFLTTHETLAGRDITLGRQALRSETPNYVRT